MLQPRIHIGVFATMEEFRSTESSFPEFYIAEIVRLENIYNDMGGKIPSQDFCQELANSFSSSAIRAGQDPITWKQVQEWFLSQSKVTLSANLPKLLDFSNASPLINGSRTSPDPSDEGVPGLLELAFEARSSKDFAWYDVESFPTFRVLSTGELEARVRFSGFGKAQDEWVNVKESLRERSIPLEPSECDKVDVGDLVLCFQERDEYAVYCDAHVVKVQRRQHDLTECRCIFVVRYHHDESEEVVQWNRLCRRPKQKKQEKQEKSIVPQNPIADLWG